MKRLIVVFCLLTHLGFSQTPVKLNKQYLLSYPKDIIHIPAAPFHWSTSQTIGTVAILGTAALVSTQDMKIHDFFQRNKTSTTTAISKHGLEPWGSGMYSMPLLGGMYLLGVLNHQDKPKEAAMLGAKSFIISGIFCQIFKFAINRERPYQVDKDYLSLNKTKSQYNFEGPYKKGSDYTSLPSGHTTAAFSVATVIATVYKDQKWVPVAAYSVAALTGISRIHDNAHWASDVITGAALGWAIGKFICTSDSWGIHVAPTQSSRTTEINIGFNF